MGGTDPGAALAGGARAPPVASAAVDTYVNRVAWLWMAAVAATPRTVGVANTGGGNAGSGGARLYSLEEVGQQVHLRSAHVLSLRLVDKQQEQAADGVPRADEVLLQALHRMEDALAEDVVKGVGVAEETQHEAAL